MLKEGGRNKAITEAITRFRHGRCPSCGKGIGEPRGMEFRPRSEDLYCHSCRKTWPTVLDIKSLEEQLVVPNETLEELPRSCPMFLVPIQRPMPLIGHRLRNVFRRVVRKSK